MKNREFLVVPSIITYVHVRTHHIRRSSDFYIHMLRSRVLTCSWQNGPDGALVARQHETAALVLRGVSPEAEPSVRVLVLPWLLDSEPHDASSPIPDAAPARSTWLNTLGADEWAGSWCPVEVRPTAVAGELLVVLGPLLDAGLFHVAVLCDGAHAEHSPFACDVLPVRASHSRSSSP